MEPTAYLRTSWNVMDFVVVLSIWFGWIGQLMQPAGHAAEEGNISYLRTARALRPLRSLRMFGGIKKIMSSVSTRHHNLISRNGRERLPVFTALLGDPDGNERNHAHYVLLRGIRGSRALVVPWCDHSRLPRREHDAVDHAGAARLYGGRQRVVSVVPRAFVQHGKYTSTPHQLDVQG